MLATVSFEGHWLKVYFDMVDITIDAKGEAIDLNLGSGICDSLS